LGWFEDEPSLATTGWAITRRLTRRAAVSWPLWVGIALALSAVLTFLRARVPSRYEAAVVLRVAEAQVAIPGAALGAGTLRPYVNELVFTNTRLIDLMSKHPGHFPDLPLDPASAVEEFRKALSTSISENDFTEERSDDDPPRSARLEIAFHASDPRLAFDVVQELSTMVVESTLGEQRASLEREQAAARTAVSKAEAGYADAKRADPTGLDPRTLSAQTQQSLAQQRLATATLALHALNEKQVLRFQVVDPGQVPAARSTGRSIAFGLAATLLATLLGGALLAGAFDPRVLDAEDLAGVGLGTLGEVPELPALAAVGPGEAVDPRV